MYSCFNKTLLITAICQVLILLSWWLCCYCCVFSNQLWDLECLNSRINLHKRAYSIDAFQEFKSLVLLQ